MPPKEAILKAKLFRQAEEDALEDAKALLYDSDIAD